MNTWEAVRARGELRWGADAFGGAPYVFQDPMDPNHLVGFEVELADAVAKRLGLRARPVLGQWDRLLDNLARGDFDVALNGIEVADEKKRVCLLSHPYYAAPELITVRKGDPAAPRTLAALAGRKVGTLPGSLAERMAIRAKAVVRGYEGGTDSMYDDLALGRLDAVLLDGPGTRYYGEIEPALEVVPGPAGEVEYAAAFRLGDGALRDAFDGALLALARDGTLTRIYRRWGLMNPATARLLGAKEGGAPVAEEWERWRAAMGRSPPFLERVRTRYPSTLGLFARGAGVTISVSLCAMALAVLMGLLLAAGRRYGPRAVKWACVGYIEAVRGTPLLIQLTMVYFGLPEIGVRLGPFVAGVVALGMNYAASEAENYRAGLESVPLAQAETAKALGLSGLQTFRLVVAPQALRISVPPMTNDFIALLKDSSLVSIVTLTELTKTYEDLASSMRDHLGLGVLVALLYLALGLPAARAGRLLEARLGRHLRKAGP